jgi:hypothetical protein
LASEKGGAGGIVRQRGHDEPPEVFLTCSLETRRGRIAVDKRIGRVI